MTAVWKLCKKEYSKQMHTSFGKQLIKNNKDNLAVNPNHYI